jgi:hypothetical protein
MTTVTLWNNSGANGGACTVFSWSVKTSDGTVSTTNQHNLMVAQKQTFDLTAAGWDTSAQGKSFFVECDISWGSQNVRSATVPYVLGEATTWEVSGPSLNASIDGPI